MFNHVADLAGGVGREPGFGQELVGRVLAISFELLFDLCAAKLAGKGHVISVKTREACIREKPDGCFERNAGGFRKIRRDEHGDRKSTRELQSLMRISYAV